MIYFYNSSNEKDRLVHPVTVSTNGGELKAFALAVLNFRKNRMCGYPVKL